MHQNADLAVAGIQDVELLATLRLSEAQLAEADQIFEAYATAYDYVFSGLLGASGLGSAMLDAWAELRPLLEQRLCDCPRDPHHRWNCEATPIWTQAVRDLDTPWAELDRAIRNTNGYIGMLLVGPPKPNYLT